MKPDIGIRVMPAQSKEILEYLAMTRSLKRQERILPGDFGESLDLPTL